MSQLPKKMLFKCTTALSINDRFTQLRGVAGQATAQQARQNTIRENNALIHQASIKNRRLAQQMERRPTVMAALKIKKKSIRQRLGPLDNGISVQDRLLLPSPSGLRVRGRFRGRGQGRGAPLRGRVGLQGRVAVLASPRGIRSFVQRNRGGVLLRQPQRSLELRQQRSQLLGNRIVGSQLSRGRLGGNRLRGSQLRGSGLRGQLRTNLPHGGQVRTNHLGGGLRGSGLRGSGLRGSGLRGSGLRARGLRGAGFRGRGLRGARFRGSGLQRGVFRDAVQLRGSGYRGTGLRGGRAQRIRGQMRGGQVWRSQQGVEHQQGVRGVRGRQQRSRGNQQNNQRVSFRGFGRNQYNQTKPSKEELDNELDKYMSNSESRLDHQMDSYMRHDSSNSWH